MAEQAKQYRQDKQQRAEPEQAKPKYKLQNAPGKPECQTHNSNQQHYHKNSYCNNQCNHLHVLLVFSLIEVYHGGRDLKCERG